MQHCPLRAPAIFLVSCEDVAERVTPSSPPAGVFFDRLVLLSSLRLRANREFDVSLIDKIRMNRPQSRAGTRSAQIGSLGLEATEQARRPPCSHGGGLGRVCHRSQAPVADWISRVCLDAMAISIGAETAILAILRQIVGIFPAMLADFKSGGQTVRSASRYRGHRHDQLRPPARASSCRRPPTS